MLAGGDDDMRPVPQPLGQRPVVELGRQPGPWIERVGRGRLRSAEEEGVGVDDDRKVVGPGAGPLRMEVRQLREREEPVLVHLRAEGRVEHGERGGRVPRESVSQVEALEHLVREAARDPRGERAGRHLLLEAPGRDRIDADRTGTGRGEGQARAQQHGPHGSPRLGRRRPRYVTERKGGERPGAREPQKLAEGENRGGQRTGAVPAGARSSGGVAGSRSRPNAVLPRVSVIASIRRARLREAAAATTPLSQCGS